MPLAVLIFSFVAGLLFGSFLNVCIYRIPRDLSVVVPRSFCPECGAQLSSAENIPLLSYLMLRARCRHCAQPIGLRYPAVELLTAFAFLLTVLHYGLTPMALKWILFEMLLIVLFWTDLEERILPDELTLGGTLLGLLLSVFLTVPGIFGLLILPDAPFRWQSLLNATLGAIFLALPIWLIGTVYGRIRKREALGFGDVKLLLMLGVFLGPEKGLLAVFAATLVGALIGVVLLIWKRGEALSYPLPLGSFLCLAAACIPFLSGRLATPLDVP
jgi:leader peptidase (prepilin peptidase) / N-methyltransferase